MRFDLTVNEFVRELHLGKELLVFDPNTWRPYCHVRDFARAIEEVLRAPTSKVAFEVFNVGCEENNFTKLMVVEEIMRHIPRSKVTYQERGADPRNYRVNFDKIRRVLNFTPEISVQQGISEILAALSQGLFDHVEEQRHFFGNYEIFLPTALIPDLKRAG
jgi:nucleoside-diphosphate-sugar epimerase